MIDNQTMQITTNQHVAFTQVDEDVVLMDPENGQFYGLNSMGAEIWNLISSKTCTIKAVFEHIIHHYEINEAQCTVDVSQFLQAMQEKGFITLTKE